MRMLVTHETDTLLEETPSRVAQEVADKGKREVTH